MFAPAKYDHDGRFVNVTESAPKNVRPAKFKTPEIPDVVSPYVVRKPSEGVPRIRGAMSQGTVAQLMSIGPQDRFLSLNPQVSFFRTAYKRHTNFAVEAFDETFGGPQLTFGNTNICTLGKHGDLLGHMTLRIVLPNLGIAGGTWVDAIGYVLLSRARLRVGDVVIQTHERLWYDIEDKLFATEGKVRGVNEMIGRGASLATDAEHEILVPLKFACCKTFSGRQQFLPVSCLDTNVDVSVEIDAESLDGCVAVPAGTTLPPVRGANCTLIVDNVYLDATERARFANGESTFMIDVVQDVDEVAYATTSEGIVPVTNVSVSLRELNMPVKYFAGVAYDESYGTSYFRYLNAFSSATFLVNSEQQFDPRGFSYFSLQQTYDRFARSESTGNVFGFSFALRAGSWQPNGALNFAPLSNPTFRFTLNGAQSTPLKVKLFATCINWVVFKNGRCAFAFDF